MLYQTLGRANELLSSSSFLNVVSRLLRHENHAVRTLEAVLVKLSSVSCVLCLKIRRKAITLLDSKVSTVAEDITDDMLPEFATLVDDLKAILLGKATTDEELLENKRAALLCLTTMAVAMAKSDPDTYIGVLDTLVGDAALLNHNNQIVASSMACLTSIWYATTSRHLHARRAVYIDYFTS